MNEVKTWAVRGLSLFSLTLACGAQAATVAMASITGLSFDVQDLDANDGVAPTLVWTSPFALVDVGRQYGQVVNLVPLANGGFTWNVSFSQSSPAVSSDDSTVFLPALSATQTGAAGSTSAQSLSASATASNGESQSASAYGSGSFTLSANTELIVRATLGSEGSAPAGAGFVNPTGVDASLGALFARALGYVELALGTQVETSKSEGTNYTPSTDLVTYPVDAFSRLDSRLVELRWSNTTTGSASGDFYALVQAEATEIGAVNSGTVPEPSALALALLALSAVACKRFRARQ